MRPNLKPIARFFRPPEVLSIPEKLGQLPTQLKIDLPAETFDIDVTDYSTLEGSAFPPVHLKGSISVILSKPDSNADVVSGCLTIRLIGKYEIDVSLTNVYSLDGKDPVDLGNFSVNKGVFYLHEQTLWYGPSYSVTLHDHSEDPDNRRTLQADYHFPPPSHSHLEFASPYPFSFPIPIDAPVTAKADAGQIVWTLEATLVQAGRHWPIVKKQEVTVRRIVRDDPPQTVPPAPRRPITGPLPRKQTVSGYTLHGEFLFEIQFPDPIRIPAKYEPVIRLGRSTSPPPANMRRRPKTKEKHRSTGRPDDELHGPEGIPVQICLRSGSRPVSSVLSISMTLGQRCHINTLDRFRPPHPAALSHGTLGMWEDNASKPIAMPSIYLGDPPPVPETSSSYLRVPNADPDVSRLTDPSSSTDTFKTALSNPPPRALQPPPSTNRAFGPGRIGRQGGGLRNLHTPGVTVSVRPGEYRFLKVPVGRGVGPRPVNGIGGNHVAAPPLMEGDRSRRNSLAMIAEGVGNVNKRVATAAGFGGDGTKYVLEVGDGEGGGECFIGVEVLLNNHTQPSVIQQNFKIAHFLTLNVTYESERKSILGTQRKLASIEVPVFVLHGAPPHPRK
ncbi:hypothetical protein HDU67_001647 [Dinochytrium kinnereticum]|nr:hypothetical protein HDU67_001647 [Dinochytrium kinnereticum]